MMIVLGGNLVMVFFGECVNSFVDCKYKWRC